MNLAASYGSFEELSAAALAQATAGDVIVTMSSGAFDGLPGKLLKALARGADVC